MKLMAMKRLGLAVHRFRDEAITIASEVASWASSHGFSVVADETDLGISSGRTIESGSLADCDVVVSIGGDGTVLRSVRALQGSPVPIVGVNLGQLGYLADVEPSEVVAALNVWHSGTEGQQFWYDDRMLLAATFKSGSQLLSDIVALNEVVIEKQEAGHTVRVLVEIDGSPFTTYVADGVIVATPTGSTAYAMSARGPILSPRLRALLVTPVSPHMLFDRSMVLDRSESVRIVVQGHRTVSVAADGNLVHTLQPGDAVEVCAADVVARFVRFQPAAFHQVLKNKFMLSDR